VCNAPEQSLAPTYLPISPRAAGGEQDLCRTLVETEEALSIIPKTWWKNVRRYWGPPHRGRTSSAFHSLVEERPFLLWSVRLLAVRPFVSSILLTFSLNPRQTG